MFFKGNILVFAYTTNSAEGVYCYSCQSQAWMKEEGLLSSSKFIWLSHFLNFYEKLINDDYFLPVFSLPPFP